MSDGKRSRWVGVDQEGAGLASSSSRFGSIARRVTGTFKDSMARRHSEDKKGQDRVCQVYLFVLLMLVLELNAQVKAVVCILVPTEDIVEDVDGLPRTFVAAADPAMVVARWSTAAKYELCSVCGGGAPGLRTATAPPHGEHMVPLLSICGGAPRSQPGAYV